jgi:EmrB/QacA subfamily drug resistance transporter
MTAQTTPQERRVTVIALLIVLLLGALDQTVVSTAMPRIIAELRGIDLYPWVTTVYLLTSTVMVPIWGKLGDLYGRKRVLMAGVLLFVAGSWLCGLSGELGGFLGGGMIQLIVFRGLQGIGGGALFTSAFAVIADLYPPRERGRLSGMFGAMFGLASVLGPLIGGFLTEHGTVSLGGTVISGWRWVFYVNLPLSLLALFMIAAKTPAMRAGKGGRIDTLGALLVLTAFVPLLLALSWGGHAYAWSSPRVLALFATTAVSLVLFAVVERRVPEPILPLTLFGIRTFTTANTAAFVISMAFMGVVTFLPLYLQLGLGVPATKSGLVMLPMMLGLILSATVSGRLVSKFGRYKPPMLAGAALLIVSVLLLSRLGANTGTGAIAWRVLLLGVSLGPVQGLFSVAVQNAVPREQLGVATSSAQFFRQIGATVGAALFGAILTHALTREMGAVHATGGGRVTLEQLETTALGHAGAGAHAMVVDPAVKTAFSAAMSYVFLAGAAIAVLGLIIVLLIPELPMRRFAPPEPVAEPGEGEGEDVGAGTEVDGLKAAKT